MIFSNPLFLIALIAVAIPIVVHLFNFRRYRKVYFSNVQFLEELQTETKRQSKLREYLVLATRILAIIFLVLAFAQPTIPNRKSPIKEGGCAVSVYIDNSFSMENTSNDGSLLQQAKSKAREIVSAFQPSDQFQLLTNDVEGVHFRWFNRDEFLLQLEELESSPSAPLMSSMAEKQHEFLRSNTSQNRFSFLISDFQNTTADLEHYPSDSLIITTFVPLESLNLDNLSIDSVYIETPLVFQGSQVTVHAVIANHGDKPVENLPVKLIVDGKERSISTANLPAQSNHTVPLSFTVNGGNVLECKVEIVDYPITFDDRFFFTLNVRNKISMLCIEGKPQPYLRKLFEHDSLVNYHTCNDRNIDFTHLGDHQFVILGELSTIPSGLAQTLVNFVQQGGSLLIIPTEDASIDGYNQLLQMVHAPHLGDYRKGTAKVTDVNREANLYRGVFSSSSDVNMEMPTTVAHFKTNTSSSTVAEAVMTYPSGDFFLSSTRYENGNIYLLTTPLRTERSDFMQQSLFVPSLYNMALFAQPLGQIYTTIDNTTPVLLPAILTMEEASWRLSNNSHTFEVIPDLRSLSGRTYFYPHNQVREADCYLISSSRNNLQVGLAFNYNRLESNMQFLSHKEVEQKVKDNHLSYCSVVRNAQKPLDQYIRDQHDAHPLWRWCILLCLIMIAIEIVLIRMPRKVAPNK